MKKLLMLAAAAALLGACSEKKPLTVSVENPLPIDRTGEMVEISMSTVAERLNLPDTALVVVYDSEGNPVPSQTTHDELLIFPATVPAGGTATYTIQIGTPQQVETLAEGHCYPRRMDDLAWENDLVGFRAYGPGLQAAGEHGYGYDLFAKRGTSAPVLEAMYASELDEPTWEKIRALRTTDRKAADELQRSITYHVDHGYGMDCYAVGATLGAGTAALMADDAIVYPWCYDACEILDNGPLRFSARLVFKPFEVQGDTGVVETRVITLDAGSHLNRTTVSYANLGHAMPVVTGIVLHDTLSASVTANAADGYIAYIDPTTGADNGKLFIGAAFPAPVQEAKAVRFGNAEKKQRNNAEGHVLAVSQYEPGAEYVYYWGFGWDRADIKDAQAWEGYLKDFAQKVRNPLRVSY